MSKKRKAELCDAVILKFKGDQSFFWKDLHGNQYLFNDLVLDSDCDTDTTPNTKYFVIQPILNLLLEDGVLKRMDNDSQSPYLSLTDKGNAIYPDIKNRGYVTKYIKERNENLKKNGLAFVSIATFLILCFKTYHEWPAEQSENKTSTVDSSSIKTDSIARADSLYIKQLIQDSATKKNKKARGTVSHFVDSTTAKRHRYRLT